MKVHAHFFLLFTLACTAGIAGEAPAELKYVKKATRDETRQATLANHEETSKDLLALLEYQLDTDFPKTDEDRFYRILTVPTPEGVQFEPGGFEILDDGRLAVSTRIGDVWIVDRVFEQPPYRPQYKLFASGLHEPLGLAKRGEWLYVTQRGELTRLRDDDGDGRADTFEIVSDGWGLSGDYHEYAFGSRFDRAGDVWIVLCLTGSFNSNVLFRGWCLKVSHDGKLTPICSGIRSPGGIGFNAAGDVFYTDNQGPWNGACYLRQLRKDCFIGHPAGNRWYDRTPELTRPPEPKSGSRIHVEMERIPQLMPPAVIFPYGKMGQSAGGVACDLSGGKFGPFEEQLFVGDQTHSTVMRVFLEKVKGYYQGACFPFRQGFGAGIIPLIQAPDGSFLAGGTARGWGSRGGKPFSLQRLVWTEEVPFEIHEMRIQRDGFELTFTKPVDPQTAGDVKSYSLQTYTYIYQSSYGSPEVDHTTPKIDTATVSKDGRSVRLQVSGLQIGHVHELHSRGVRSASGEPLLHDVAYYTLFFLPE